MNVVSSMIGSGISFLSLEYLAFLLAAALVRYLCPERARTAVLLAFSWLFYAAWNPVCLLFLIFTTVSTYLTGQYVSGRSVRAAQGTGEGDARSNGGAGSVGAALFLCVAANLGVLFFCKYWGMFFPGIFEQRLLPVGISFYTLQALGYVVDCWREGKAAKASAQASSGGNSSVRDGGKNPEQMGRVFLPMRCLFRFFRGFCPARLSGGGICCRSLKNPAIFPLTICETAF